MKGMKKLLTGILAATMIMGSSMTAFATEDTGNEKGSITINRHDSYNEEANNTQVAQKYTWYKLMDATIIPAATESDTAKAAYSVDTKDKADALVKSTFFKATKVNDNHYNIALADNVENNEATAKAMAAYFAGDGKNDLSLFDQDTVDADADGSTFIPNLDKGYYYITSELGTNAIVKTLGDEELTEKNHYPTVDKTQKDTPAANVEYGNGNVGVGVGDKVYYQIVVNVPAGTSDDIIVTDTMSQGLDFLKDNNDAYDIAISGYWPNTTTVAATVSDRTFTVNLPKNTTSNDAQATITFTAVVNQNAIVDTGKKNEVTIEYGNYHHEDTVYYDTYRAAAFKYDGATGDELDGVQFTLRDKNTTEGIKVTLHDDGYYYISESGNSTVVTNDEGFILIRGLDNGTTYELVETKTQAGYNLLDAPKQLNLVKDEKKDEDQNLIVYTYAPEVDKNEETNLPLDTQTYTELVTIANLSGTLLPSTGGIGTTIFYIIGGVLIIAGVAYFIVRRKADAE